MKQRASICGRLVPALLLVFTALEVHAGGLGGRWRLTDQRYNGGGYNFAGGATFTLVLEPDATAGRIVTDRWDAVWPAWPGPDGPALLAAPPVIRHPAADRVEADYRVVPAPGDETALAVTERCTLADANTLRCDVEVRFDRAGNAAGGFTWQRTFVREGAR